MPKTATWRKTPFAHKFYHSAAWQKVRAFVWDRSKGLCERCMERGEYKPADVVHHTVPLTPENMGDPDISLNPDRLVALCHDCHTEVHQQLGIGAMNGVKKEAPRVGFDEEGNVVKLEQGETLQDFLDEWRYLDEHLDGTMEMPQAFAEGLAAHGYRVNEEGNVVRLG